MPSYFVELFEDNTLQCLRLSSVVNEEKAVQFDVEWDRGVWCAVVTVSAYRSLSKDKFLKELNDLLAEKDIEVIDDPQEKYQPLRWRRRPIEDRIVNLLYPDEKI